MPWAALLYAPPARRDALGGSGGGAPNRRQPTKRGRNPPSGSYLDGLMGPYPEAKAVYEERSPIHSADKISAPCILFQAGGPAGNSVDAWCFSVGDNQRPLWGLGRRDGLQPAGGAGSSGLVLSPPARRPAACGGVSLFPRGWRPLQTRRSSSYNTKPPKPPKRRALPQAPNPNPPPTPHTPSHTTQPLQHHTNPPKTG